MRSSIGLQPLKIFKTKKYFPIMTLAMMITMLVILVSKLKKNPVLCIDEEPDDKDYIPAEIVSITDMMNLWRYISILTYHIFTEARGDYQVTIDLIEELRKLGAKKM